MTKRTGLVLLAVFVLSTACGDSKKAAAEVTGQAPETADLTINDLDLHSLDGTPLKENELKGKRVFVNFWATWCKPCLAEMPSIDKAATMLEGKDVVFIAASDEKLSRVQNFRDQNTYRFNIVGTSADLSKLGVFAIPATFIFDEEGALVFKEIGARDWASPESIALITETQRQK